MKKDNLYKSVDLKDLILRFQEDKDNTIVNEIMKLVNCDLSEFGDKEKDYKDVNQLVFVAYRIRAKMLNDYFEKEKMNNLYCSKEEREEFEGLKDWINDLIDGKEWLNINKEEVLNYNFDSVKKYEYQIKKYYKGQSSDLFYLIKKFAHLNIDSQAFKIKFKADVKDDKLPIFRKALRYALSKVDVERSDKEIIKYINRLMMTKYIHLNIEATGVKRVKVGDETFYIKPKFDLSNVENSVWMMLINKSLVFVGADAFDDYLTKSQRQLLNDAYEIVKEQYESENVEFFHFDKNGKTYLNKRELAHLLDENETNLKQKLKRIETKIHENWKVVMNNRKKQVN